MLSTIMVVSSEIVISSEKSLQVELDYSEIINHIQLHENKFCLHVRDYSQSGKTSGILHGAL